MSETTKTETTGTGTTGTGPTRAAGRGRAGHIGLWILQVLGAAIFIFAGYSKLKGDAQQIEGFEAMGLGVAGMYIVGVLEIAGAVGLLLPGVAGFAGICLVALMVGATIATIGMMGFGPLVAVPVVTLILAAVIAWGRRRTVPRFVNALLGR
ncbi:MAG TPA: DoxX family protein [Pseudonocardia sp.]|jgi:uncharacterized membrane protein|nr:DoxX family protein [Pseudonocardia sp.]